jgi:hypothetical protein
LTGNRLWIQRVPPSAAKAKGSKRKRASAKERQKLDPKVVSTSAKRPRLSAKPSNPALTLSGRRSRAAKDQAKFKLDIQAKELAELNRAAFLEPKPRPSHQQSHGPARSLGTRTSARLRGVSDGDWQSIPDEWLDAGGNSNSEQTTFKAQKTGLESDEDTISDLTELSEAVSEGSVETSFDEVEPDEENEERDSDEREESGTNDFAEWETVQHFPFICLRFGLLSLSRFAPTSMSGSISQGGSRKPRITAKRLCIKRWLMILSRL